MAHSRLLEFQKALGYPNLDEGLCHGFALRWLEASLLGPEEQARFEKRVYKIVSAENLTHLANAIRLTQERVRINSVQKNGYALSSHEQELLDILAFYDSLSLYQKPDNYPLLFNKSSVMNQNDLEIVAKFASSEMIQELGGIKATSLGPLILTEDELINYLLHLESLCKDLLKNSKDPIGFLISNRNHSVALNYLPQKGWQFRDVNQPFEGYVSYKQLAKAIFTGLSDLTTPYIAFDANIMIINDNQRQWLINQSLASFQTKFPINKDTAQRTAGSINLAHLAAKHGHDKVIKTLAEAGADLNQANKEGMSPILIATCRGHHKVVKVLIEEGVNLDVTLENNTLAHIAAYRGYHEIIRLLADAKFDLNQLNSQDEAPIHLAARYGYPEMVKALVQSGADLTRVNDDSMTAAHIAALHNHPEVMKVLVELKTDFKVLDSNGKTPIDIAVLCGHLEVVRVLTKTRANFIEKNDSSEDSDDDINLNTSPKASIQSMNYPDDYINKFMESYDKLLQKNKSSLFSIFTKKEPKINKSIPLETIINYAQKYDGLSRKVFISLGWMTKDSLIVNLDGTPKPSTGTSFSH